MNSAYELTVQLFYQLSNLFFWPVSIALIILFVWSLIELGRLFSNAWQRRSDRPTDLHELNEAFSEGFASATLQNGRLNGVPVSMALQRFWLSLSAKRTGLLNDDLRELILEQVLRAEESAITGRLDFSRALVRLGPMLGLAGTIIPLGPALQSLLGGDMAGMVGHLVVGFGAVVCGLVMSGIAYVITLVRERWSRTDLEEMEHLCEIIVRAGKSTGKESLHASLRA